MPNKVQLNFCGILVSFGLISVLARPINFTPLGISRLDKVVQQMEVVKMAIFYPQNKVVLTIFVPVRDVNSVVFLFCFLESFSNRVMGLLLDFTI